MSPLRCECKRFPIVEREDAQEFYVFCRNPYCRNKSEWGTTVEEAIAKWNAKRKQQAEK